MVLVKKPFERQALEGEEKDRDNFTVALSPEEREWIDEMKLTLDLKSDSQCIKVLAEWGKNTIKQGLRPETLHYLIRKDRARLSDHIDIEKPFRKKVLKKDE